MELDLATRIAEVTVYPERALVTRRGETAFDAPGEHTLRIGGLPLTLDRASLRANGRGPAGMRILGVEQAEEFHAAAPEETLQRLRDEVARLERALALLDERRGILGEQRAWLRSLAEQSARTLARGIARGAAKAEDASALFTYTGDETQRLAVAQQELDREREETARELQARSREYAELGGGKRPDRLAASVRILLTTPGPVEVDLSYLIAGASWSPRYDARVDLASGRVRLTQQALLRQRTGEAWSDVALALSTAQPSAAVALPDEPDPWYVDVLRPAPPLPAPGAAPMARRRVRRPGAASDEEESGESAASMLANADYLQAMVEAPMQQVSAERAGAAQVFRVPGGVDAPSDGAPHTLSLGEYDLPCRLEYVAAPVVAPGAHLRARTSNATGQALLPGALHIFHSGAAGDEYLGATRIELTAENADLTLYLGVDDNVPVKRELVERDTDKGSLLQRGVRLITYGYRVMIGNRTGAPQRIVYQDRLPVPRHERIKLRVLDLKPQPTTRTRLDQLTWEFSLAPNEERVIEWRFVVESPADMELVGLP